ncbi:MAG: hypothetical protein PHO62_08250 [Sulfurimonas sp.]|uniref:hypothetical protein n=1 Tax=Sulfurimonas sp. TaxID=2022749 RepID=UPI002627751E|nr:hypothetical protein [Sulfurimonas sp.]MDD5373400.1 hypothetical protein [Sulfurimonas sp.]
MFYKNIIYTLTLSILFFGCSTSNQALNTKPASKSSYVSQSGYYYALIEKNNSGWKIVDIKDTEIEKRAKTNQEILKVNEANSQVNPNFAMNSSNVYVCRDSNNSSGYTPCTSNLTSAVAPENIVGLIKNLDAKSPKQKYVDKELIDEAVIQTNLFKAIESKKIVFERAQCDRLFLAAKTADELDAFIEKYSSYAYASTLIPIAVKNRDNIKLQEQNKKLEEERLAKASEQKILKSEKQLEKENINLAKTEQRAIDNYTRNIENFRKNIKKGVETNCGLVVDVKESQAKIDFTHKDSVNELWIDAKKLFPKGHGCRFVNGKYIAPATF